MDWKTLGKKLLFPPVWLLLLLSAACAYALIRIFLDGMEQTVPAYLIYALSAYTLTAVCIFLGFRIPKWYKGTRKRIYAHPLGEKYMTDAAFKVRVSLYISLGINLLYSAMKLAAGVYYASFWWGAVAVYYILLSLLRFLLLRYMRANPDQKELLSEYHRYRLCGILMLILNLSLTGIVFQMVWQNKGYSYPGVLIFAVAAYTFYTVTISVVDIIRYRKYKSPVMSASKAIRFAAALVSLLSMETAMLAQFGEDETFRLIMTACTGAGVCIIVLSISVYMIVHSGREISKLKESQA